ncbi:MAG: hypothetical protein IJ618_09660 [Prevotella sp.]|nr:hypothetical protein [Prevotella sp.]
MNKFICCLAFSAMAATGAYAQGTNSPYSQYGFGDLTDQSVGFNKGMSGVAQGFRKGNEVNPANPASYSAVDSLTFLFDGGFSGQYTRFKENGTKLNGKNGGFDYVMGLFRVTRNFGVSFGVMPFSNIGYNYSSKERFEDVNTTITTTHNGSGGISQLYLGAGWRIIKPLSVGFNLSYLWGDYNMNITTSSTSDINTLSKQYLASMSSYKLDIGVQAELPLNKDAQIVLGATFSPGHKFNGDPRCLIIHRNTAINKSDTTSYSAGDDLELPTAWTVGVAYNHGKKLRVGADFQMQHWAGIQYPDYVKAASNGSADYVMREGLLRDCQKVNVGAEWTPNPSGRKYLQHVRYRIGAGYTTPYYNINGQQGPKEFHASIGFGIPILNSINNRSIVNISAQWARRSAENLITENSFRINIGITFNERWFAKWKVE